MKHTYIAAIFGKHPKVKVRLKRPYWRGHNWCELIEHNRRLPLMTGGDERHVRRSFLKLYGKAQG